MAGHQSHHSIEAVGIADILERILDKGVIITGDIKISIADIELLSIKIRLMIASVDKAKEMGINWWENDPYLSTGAQKEQLQQLENTNRLLTDRLAELEAKIANT